MATKSSAVIGSLNIPNVPPVAPAWPSADVVAQQSVSVTVLKPANGGVAAMAYTGIHVPFSYAVLMEDSTQQLVRNPESAKVSMPFSLRRLSRFVDGAAALRLGSREDAVRRDDGVGGPERGAARACVNSLQ